MINGSVINGAAINSGIALDEEAYQLWLRNPTSSVCHLVWIDYNGTSAVYPNWVKYTLKLSDLPYAGHHDRIKNVGSFSQQIGDRFSGVVTASIGEIELDNADGTLDAWHNLSVDGQRVKVLHGDPSWDVDRFRLVYECIAEAFVSSDNTSLRLRVRSPSYQYNLPIQTNLVGTTTVNSTSNLPIPRTFGQIFNAEPVLVDSANLIYQWNDGAVTEVSDVRDGGIRFRTAQIAISSVVGNLISTATAHGFYVNDRVRCDIGSMPSAANWFGIAWNGSVFCTVASSSSIAATSPDGINWTQQTLPVSANWNKIAWNGSVFCTVASSSSIAATSPDGITWTQRTLPTFAGWYGIAWNGSVFCVVAPGSTDVATSPDGITWAQQTFPAATGGYAIAWNGSVFCAVPINSSIAATSPDGITWTQRTLPVSAYWQSIAWNGSVFCALAYATSIAATSPDGITWTQRILPVSANWADIVWNGSVFCAVADTSSIAATSPDGITWTQRTLPVSAGWYTLAWNGSVFCVPTDSTYVTTSSDGITWSAVTSTLPTPLAKSTDYWVIPDGLTTTAFKLSATRGGTVITLTNTTTGATLIGYHWTADLTTGKVQMSSSPTGVITLDGSAGGLLTADIVTGALSASNISAGSHLHFQNENVDTQSYLAFEETCPQTMGIYIKDRRNRIDVASEVVRGVGAWYGYGREGMLRFGRVEGNPASYDFALIESDFFPNSLHIEQLIAPEKKHRIGYRKNWTNQSGALFAAVSADNRELYSMDKSTTQAHDSSDMGANGSFHQLNIIPDAQESLIYLASDADEEAVRLDAMYYGWGAIFVGEVGRVGTSIDVGQVVNVTYPRFGLSGGVNMTCIGFDDNRTSGKITVRFFVALANYTPGQL